METILNLITNNSGIILTAIGGLITGVFGGFKLSVKFLAKPWVQNAVPVLMEKVKDGELTNEEVFDVIKAALQGGKEAKKVLKEAAKKKK